MNRRILLFAGLLFASTAFGPRAAADEPTNPESVLASRLKGEAWELYKTGRELFVSGDVAAALGKFTRAHELSAEGLLMWNRAACEAKLRHWARAMMLLDRYSATQSDATERDRSQTEAFRASAGPFVAAVDLSSLPPGIHVTVDGDPIGTTPLLGPLYLDAGRRRVSFSRPGYRGIIRTETVRGGTSLAWTVTLERLNVRILGDR